VIEDDRAHFADFWNSPAAIVHPERTRQIARDVTVFGAAAVPVNFLQQQDVGVEAAQFVEDGGVRRSPLDVPRDDLEAIFSVQLPVDSRRFPDDTVDFAVAQPRIDHESEYT
jgi:hypothetical protein